MSLIKNVDDSNGLMIINKSGIAIRMAVENLRVMGRATQGVKLINIKEGDSIAAVAKVVHEDDNENEDINEETQKCNGVHRSKRIAKTLRTTPLNSQQGRPTLPDSLLWLSQSPSC